MSIAVKPSSLPSSSSLNEFLGISIISSNKVEEKPARSRDFTIKDQTGKIYKYNASIVTDGIPTFGAPLVEKIVVKILSNSAPTEKSLTGSVSFTVYNSGTGKEKTITQTAKDLANGGRDMLLGPRGETGWLIK